MQQISSFIRSIRLKQLLLASLLVIFSGMPSTVSSSPKKANTKVATERLCSKAFNAFRKAQWKEGAAMAKGNCAHLREIAMWQAMLEADSGYSFQEITNFIKSHPHWPLLESLQKRAEEAITPRTPDENILKWFAPTPPLTGPGNFHYIKALLRSKKNPQALEILRKSWHTLPMTGFDEKLFRDEFKAYLQEGDHLKRVDMLLWQENTAAATPLLKLLTPVHQKWAQSRIAFIENKPDAGNLSREINLSAQKSPFLRAGLSYDRLKFYRKQEDPMALELYLKIPAEDRKAYPKLWWKEKNVLARRAINNKDFITAYQIAKIHYLKEGTEKVDAEFLLGWLSLRFTQHPQLALGHFQQLYSTSLRPISKARGAYWLGRTEDKLGNSIDAKKWYKKAAQYQSTYYGQLAAQKIKQTLQIQTNKLESLAYKKFLQKPLVQAAIILNQAGHTNKSRAVLNHLAKLSPDIQDSFAIIKITQELDPYYAGWIIKDLSMKREIINRDAYPTVPLPKGPVPSSLIHGLIRQESRFDTTAVSHAGAKGLMQLMPNTAKEVCKSLNVKYSEGKLNADPAYNLRLGKAHVEDLIETLNGSEVLTIAAYNAGIKPIKEWIERNGDPRHLLPHSIDMVDWIEMIPYFETRTYVQRVLSNKRIYEQLLNKKV